MFKVLSKIKHRIQLITIDTKEKVGGNESPEEKIVKKTRRQREGVTNQLEIVLEVIQFVRGDGIGRTKAIQMVADKRSIRRATVSDKCCRLLGINAETFDKMLSSPDMKELRELLTNKWENQKDFINQQIDSVLMVLNKERVDNQVNITKPDSAEKGL